MMENLEENFSPEIPKPESKSEDREIVLAPEDREEVLGRLNALKEQERGKSSAPAETRGRTAHFFSEAEGRDTDFGLLDDADLAMARKVMGANEESDLDQLEADFNAYRNPMRNSGKDTPEKFALAAFLRNKIQTLFYSADLKDLKKD